MILSLSSVFIETYFSLQPGNGEKMCLWLLLSESLFGVILIAIIRSTTMFMQTAITLHECLSKSTQNSAITRVLSENANHLLCDYSSKQSMCNFENGEIDKSEKGTQITSKYFYSNHNKE